jgi:hypothetical protein
MYCTVKWETIRFPEIVVRFLDLMALNVHVLGGFHFSIARLDERQDTTDDDVRKLSDLESLPSAVLGTIASEIDFMALGHLLLASPVFVQQLRNGVQWKVPPSGGGGCLPEMRIATLASVQTIEKLVIKSKPPVEAVVEKIRRLLLSTSLRKVELGGTKCIEGEKISDTVSYTLPI